MSQAGALNNNGGGGGGTADIQKINVQTGTSPVVTTNNTITFNGAVVAAGTNPVRTDGTAPATMALEVQTAQAIASTDATKIGLAAFNSADFTVDANGFVSTIGGGGITTIDGDTGSVTGATVSLKGNATAGASVDFIGSGTAMTFNVTDGSNNTYIGASSGPGSIPGVTNTAFGYNTLTSLSSGSDNVAIGANALNSLSSGSENCAIGNTCCQHLSSGIWNVLLGSAVMRSATSGSHNVAMGTISLINLSSGSYNTVFGDSAGTNYTGSESSNILLSNAGVVSESNVIHIGTQGTGNGQQNACFVAGISGVSVSNTNMVTIDTTTGQLGSQAVPGGGGITTIDGDSGSVTGSTVSIISNVAALNAGSTVQFTGSGTTLTYSNTDGSGNMAIGLLSGNPATSGSRNNAFGFQSQTSITTGTNNVAIGPFSSFSITDGVGNTSVGDGSLIFTSSGNHNTVVGTSAAQGSPGGSDNTAIGYEALQQCNTGNSNIAIGSSAAHNYTASESSNIVIGNLGILNESNVIRIGTQGTGGGQQASCYIAGIEGSAVSGSAVIVNPSTGQLGVNGTSTNTAQPCFLAYLSATQSNVTGNGANYTIPFDTVVFDQNSNYNNSTGVFTAPVTGKYFFTCGVLTLNQTSTPTYSSQQLQIVATSITLASRVDQPISNAVGFSIGYAVNGIVPMTAGDTCHINILIGGNGTDGTSVFGSASPSYTYFSGNLVC